MKRYALFAGQDYYPSGGWDDFQSSHDTADQAVTALTATAATSDCDWDWAHIIDLHTGTRTDR